MLIRVTALSDEQLLDLTAKCLTEVRFRLMNLPRPLSQEFSSPDSDAPASKHGKEVILTKDFNLTIRGKLGDNVLPTELSAPDSAFGKAWKNFVRDCDSAGIQVTTGNIESNGKTNALAVGAHAGI